MSKPNSTGARAHQHAAAARKKPGLACERGDRVLRCSRGTLTAKIHLASDGSCRYCAAEAVEINRPDGPVV